MSEMKNKRVFYVLTEQRLYKVKLGLNDWGKLYVRKIRSFLGLQWVAWVKVSEVRACTYRATLEKKRRACDLAVGTYEMMMDEHLVAEAKERQIEGIALGRGLYEKRS